MNSNVLTGTAGVYYVASQLAAREFHAALTHGNAPSVDILVGSLDGTASASLQVKSARQVLTSEGRGSTKEYYYHWRVSERSVPLGRQGLFFVFVNLKTEEFVSPESEKKALPDILIVPSDEVHTVLAAATKKSDEGWYWVDTQEWEKRKNNWTLLDAYLGKAIAS